MHAAPGAVVIVSIPWRLVVERDECRDAHNRSPVVQQRDDDFQMPSVGLRQFL